MGVFHTSVVIDVIISSIIISFLIIINWSLFNEVKLTASFLRSRGLLKVFWLIVTILWLAQSAGAAEYTDFTLQRGQTAPNESLR